MIIGPERKIVAVEKLWKYGRRVEGRGRVAYILVRLSLECGHDMRMEVKLAYLPQLRIAFCVVCGPDVLPADGRL